MSRIGRRPIPVPAGVDVAIDGKQRDERRARKGELVRNVASRDAVEHGEW